MHGNAPDPCNLTVALEMAEAGLPVFPADVTFNDKKQTWEKRPCIKNWQQEATTDAQRLRDWWGEWPGAVPGLELGRANLIMLDPDRHGGEDGVANFAALVAQHKTLPDHPLTPTAGDGEHHYFTQPNGIPFTNAEGDLKGRGINVRGKGGWAVAPGSLRPDGKRWGPTNLATAYSNNQIPVLPDWLADMIRPPRKSKPAAKPRRATEDATRVEAALRYIPSQDRTTWFEVGAALHDTGWSAARSIWDAWSQTTPSAFDPADQAKTWRSFDRPYAGKPKTLASLFHLAQMHGYREYSVRREPPSDLANDAPKPSGVVLSLRDWLKRDLPAPDFLLGAWLTTTSRVFLYGPTGRGKTHAAMAIGMACAASLDFLNWRGVRPCRVLFIDGEMSSRLLQRRLADEAARLGAVPDGFHALSHEDVENFAPLNTPQGQAFINSVIERIGGVDLIVFDNVMSLISGDQKDEESWRQTVPWVRSLTKRSISQLWIHHTGHDESHSYGSKTREWQMDTVIKLEQPDEEQSGDLFKLVFDKARERTPETRADFDNIKVALVADMWTCGEAGVRKAKVSPLGLKFLDALRDATIGNEANKMHGCPAATIASWRAECGKRGLVDGEKDHSARTLFAKHKRELIVADRIACNDTMAWIVP
jgi:Bifunctional DNA primase/polymerase, N-terminal/AAA domain/Primase C terminal 2 (PriCT-2)